MKHPRRIERILVDEATSPPGERHEGTYIETKGKPEAGRFIAEKE